MLNFLKLETIDDNIDKKNIFFETLPMYYFFLFLIYFFFMSDCLLSKLEMKKVEKARFPNGIWIVFLWHLHWRNENFVPPYEDHSGGPPTFTFYAFRR